MWFHTKAGLLSVSRDFLTQVSIASTVMEGNLRTMMHGVPRLNVADWTNLFLLFVQRLDTKSYLPTHQT